MNIEHAVPAGELLYELYLNGVLDNETILNSVAIEELEDLDPADITGVILEVRGNEAHVIIELED